MDRNRPPGGLRAAVLAVALFAITLNFLQPLAHAAMLRDGGPQAAARMWGAFCEPSADGDDAGATGSAAQKLHECCLGLAHAPALVAHAATFLALPRRQAEAALPAADDVARPGRIRDGPNQPRAPPLSFH